MTGTDHTGSASRALRAVKDVDTDELDDDNNPGGPSPAGVNIVAYPLGRFAGTSDDKTTAYWQVSPDHVIAWPGEAVPTLQYYSLPRPAFDLADLYGADALASKLSQMRTDGLAVPVPWGAKQRLEALEGLSLVVIGEQAPCNPRIGAAYSNGRTPIKVSRIVPFVLEHAPDDIDQALIAYSSQTGERVHSVVDAFLKDLRSLAGGDLGFLADPGCLSRAEVMGAREARRTRNWFGRKR